MPWEVDPQWEAALGLAGTVSAIALFIAPIKTFQRIVANKSTEEFPSFPYASALLNCAVWVLYSLPSITPNRYPPLVTNAIGLLFQAAYLALFARYATGKAKAVVRNQLAAFAAFMTLFIAFVIGALPPDFRSPVVGSFATVFTVVMFGAPLSSLSVVLRLRSVDFMPLPLSLMSFVCSAVWMAYGTYVQDAFVIVPNALGCLLGLIQLSIYYVVSSEAKRRVGVEKVVEMEEQMPLQGDD